MGHISRNCKEKKKKKMTDRAALASDDFAF
jgi:hypothetical protein